MSLRDRFTDRNELIEALLHQNIVRGDSDVARSLSEVGDLIEFSPGQTLIAQGAADRDAYFILAGKAQIIINGVRLYTREAGVSVGEMSAINSKLLRSATIEAVEPTVALRVSPEQLLKVAEAAPQLWRLLAIDLSSRLEQRNKLINRANTKPNVFIISSAEALPVARTLRVGLEYVAQTELWSDEEIFRPGSYPIEALELKVAETDFGIAIAQPDDLTTSRGVMSSSPRDNVLFELGFFMSRLGRHRTILLVPRIPDLKLPSDFKGLTPITYDAGGTDSRTLGPVIDRLTGIIHSTGVRASLVEAL